MTNIINAYFDGDLQAKKGDRIKVFRGIIESPTKIRVSSLENITTGLRKVSMIDQMLMTNPPIDLETPLEGRIHGNIEFKDGTTHFKILEGDVAKRKEFSPSTKQAELLESDGKCRDCDTKLIPGNFEFDHKDGNPLNNSRENCYVRCRNCHGIKTEKEQKLRAVG